jgi:hypothetical protein
MLFIRWPNSQQPAYQVSATSAQAESKEKQPESDPSGWWAWLLKDAAGFFTFGLVTIGIGQAFLFFIQLRYMRSGMDDATIAASAAKESADTAKIQAEVAVGTLKAMQDTAERQLRAYVFAAGAKLTDFSAGKIVRASFVVKNTGQTPAYDLAVIYGMGADFRPPSEKLDVDWSAFNPPRGSVGPGQTTHCYPELSKAISQDLIDQIAAGKAAIWVWGEIRYKDAFNKDRKTRFRFIHEGATKTDPPGLMATDTEGNEAT